MRLEPTGCEEIDQINRRLADNYGLDINSDNPKYRIVWSSHQMEHRHGTYSDFTREGIFLRTVTEVRPVHKYPIYPDMWVLETIQGNDGNPELKAKWSFEPLWVFGSGNSDPNPDWEHTIQVVHAHKFVERRKKLTPGELQAKEDERFLKEKAKMKTIIQDNSEYLVGALVAGEAVSVPHNYERADKNDAASNGSN